LANPEAVKNPFPVFKAVAPELLIVPISDPSVPIVKVLVITASSAKRSPVATELN
jgi:hypothetical protein